jgi:hypothetical protein
MAYYPFAPEVGATYRLVGPNGITAVFNDQFDPDFAGMLTEVSGLDSPEVRESASDLVQADGGMHGDFYYGRRPIVLTGKQINHPTVAFRNLRMDKARRASDAMRGDSVLSWKPSTRLENLLPNGSFEPSVTGGSDTVGWTLSSANSPVTSAAPALSATWAYSGTKSLSITATHDATATGGAVGSLDARTANGNANRFPVAPGKNYTASYYLNVTDATPTGTARVRIYWYKADGTASTVTVQNTGTGIATSSTGVIRPFVSAVAPSDAYFAGIYLEPLQAWTTASDTFAAYLDAVMVNEGTTPLTYFNGDTAGYYWQGTAHQSASGDYIEMLTWVRRNQPFRETDSAWAKSFQIALVSQYAPLFSAQQRSAAAVPAGTAATVENRGSSPSPPIFRMVNPGPGSVTAPYITSNLGPVLRTTSALVLASGETVEIDTRTRQAYFIAGARNGQAANRYIDYVNMTTGWPLLQAAGNTNFTLTGAGMNMTVLWRDTWI